MLFFHLTLALNSPREPTTVVAYPLIPQTVLYRQSQAKDLRTEHSVEYYNRIETELALVRYTPRLYPDDSKALQS